MIYGEKAQTSKLPSHDPYEMSQTGFWVPKSHIQFRKGKLGSSQQDSRAFMPEHVSFRDSAKVMGAAILESLKHDESDRELEQLTFDEAVHTFSRSVIENDELYKVVIRLLDEITRRKEAIETTSTNEIVVLPWRSEDGCLGVQVREIGRIGSGENETDVLLTRSIRIAKVDDTSVSFASDLMWALYEKTPSELDELSSEEVAAAETVCCHFLKTWKTFTLTCEQSNLELYETELGTPVLQPQVRADDADESR
jgi:DNA polymerase II large subunit